MGVFYADRYNEPGSTTDGLQEAIDAAAAAGGGVVVLESRSYRLRRPGTDPLLLLRSQVTLQGCGPATTKVYANTDLGDRVLVQTEKTNDHGSRSHHCGLRDLKLLVAGASVTPGTVALSTRDTSMFSFENVWLEGKNRRGGTGWRTDGGLSGRLVGGRISSLDIGILFTNGDEPGGKSQRSNDITLDSLKFSGPLGVCIQLEKHSTSGLTVRNSAIEGSWIGLYAKGHCPIQSMQNHYEASVAQVLLDNTAPAFFYGDHFSWKGKVGRIREQSLDAYDAYFGCHVNGDLIYNQGRARAYAPGFGSKIARGLVTGDVSLA